MIIWLASYPRSGNTFFRVLLNSIFEIKTYSIYNDRGDIGADEQTAEVVGHQFLPEDFDIESARKDDQLFIIKTHDYPSNDTDKAIYLMRDGRESTLSYTKHVKIHSNQQKSLLDVIYGNINFGSWGNHIDHWRPNHRKQTLLIKFEELVDHPQDFIAKISKFIEIEPKGSVIPTFAELKKLNPRFFRSGKKDSWKAEFSENEHLAFWMKNYCQMQAYGYCTNIPDAIINVDHLKLIKYLSSENAYLLNSLLHHYAQLLSDKNKQLEKNKRLLNERNQQLVAKENTLRQQTHRLNKLQGLENIVHELLHINTLTRPFDKIRAYKKILVAYRERKDL